MDKEERAAEKCLKCTILTN